MAPRTSRLSSLGRATAATRAGSAQRARRSRAPLFLGSAALLAVALVAVALLGRDSNRVTGPLRPLGGDDPGVAHVHGLGVDPADRTLYAATHFGIFRIPEQGRATRIAVRYQDTMGFTVAGPRTFLGSGHPDAREELPPRLGLIESTDAGQTWKALSLSGEADFHNLEASHGLVYGFDSGTATFMVSDDRRNWERRARLPMADFAVSPSSADTVLATTQQGLARSTDGGRTFQVIENAPVLVVLAWPADDVLFGASPDGVLHASPDGGSTWARRGRLDGAPQSLAAVDAQRLYAATESGIHRSADGGRTFTLRYSNR